MRPLPRFEMLLCSALLLLLVTKESFTQNRGALSDPPAREIEALNDSLRSVGEQLELLQHFLEASTVDPTFVQFMQVKAWIVNNPALRDSLFYALLQSDSSIQSEAGSDAEVLATPWDDLIQVRFGTAVFKGITLEKALDRSSDKSLYKQVAESYRYSKDIELRDPTFHLETPLQPELLTNAALLSNFDPIVPHGTSAHALATAELSLDRFRFRIGPQWGGEVRLGVDEINNPLWANGTMEVLGTFNRLAFGFVLPFGAGKTNVNLFPPFLFRGRRLTGARGFMTEADLGAFGGLFSVTRFSSNDSAMATDPKQFDFVSGILNLYYSFGVALDPTNLLRAKVGLGVHRITDAALIPVDGSSGTEYVGLGNMTTIVSPYLKVEYLNRDVSDHYLASIQWYNLTVMLTGNMEIIPNLLSLEVKYVWPIAGDLKRWSYPEFFVISPTLHIAF